MKFKYLFKNNFKNLSLKSSYHLNNILSSKDDHERLVKQVNSCKKIFFTLTSGRAGSQSLTNLLSCVEGITATHEPNPNFEWHLKEVEHNPRLAKNFWVHQKLPAILTSPNEIYVETSHMFSKGYFPAAFDLDLKMNVFCLSNSLRSTANSYYRLNVIPERTVSGRRFITSPKKSLILPYEGWENLDSYQLCYWYALESEARQKIYSQKIRNRGGKVIWVKTDCLSKKGEIERILGEIGVVPSKEDLRRISDIRSVRFNKKSGHKKQVQSFSSDELEEKENYVREKLGFAT